MMPAREHPLPVGLSKPALRALAAEGITCLEQLARRSQLEIENLHGVGPNAIKTLRQALTQAELTFAGEESTSG